MIDWERIAELKREIGEEDFAEVAEMFIEEVEEVIGRLSTQNDLTQLEDDLHFLKSSALNLGFKQMAAMCQDGESQSAKGEAQDVELEPILTCYEASKSAFQAG